MQIIYWVHYLLVLIIFFNRQIIAPFMHTYCNNIHDTNNKGLCISDKYSPTLYGQISKTLKVSFISFSFKVKSS